MRTKSSDFCVKSTKILTSILDQMKVKVKKECFSLLYSDILQAFAMNKQKARNKGKAQIKPFKLAGIGY